MKEGSVDESKNKWTLEADNKSTLGSMSGSIQVKTSVWNSFVCLEFVRRMLN